MQSTTSIFRVGIVGAGYVSLYHLRALQKISNVRLVGIADVSRDRAAQLAQQFNIPASYGNVEELLAAGCDVVHVLTPPAYHAPIAIAAMRQGSHVFVEKPMAETVAECDQMMAVAAETGRILSINHSARWDPVVLQAIELVRSKACGDLLAVDFFRTSDYAPYAGGPLPPPYRNGSYPFQDIGVHALYLLEAFLGPIQTTDIRFYSSGRDPILLFDEWRGLVECERGAGQMYISWNANPMQNSLVIHCTKGIIRVDCYLQMLTVDKTFPLPKPLQRMLGEGLNALRKLWLVPSNTLKFLTGKLAPNPGIQVSIQRFYEALSAGKQAPVTPEEGRRMIACLTEVSERADQEKTRAFAPRPAVQQPRILVTGSNGFLGGALLRRLKASPGEPIRLLLRRPPATEHPADPNIHVVYGDLGQPDVVDRAVEGIDVVYHIGAAMKGGGADFQRGTVWGTRNVVDACVRHKVKRLVYVSSMSVLDHAGHKPATPVTEASPCEPHPDWRGFYTQTKLEAEKIVLDAVRQHHLPAVVLRPGQIFGKGTEKFPPSGCIGLGGRWIVVGSGDRPVPFVYVEDVVDSILLAASQPDVVGQVFQIVDPTLVTQREYIDRALPALGSSVRASYVPEWFLYLASWGVETLGKVLKRNVPLSRYRIRSIRPLWPCDQTAAQKKLGWTPTIGTKEGIRLTFGG